MTSSLDALEKFSRRKYGDKGSTLRTVTEHTTSQTYSYNNLPKATVWNFCFGPKNQKGQKIAIASAALKFPLNHNRMRKRKE